MEKSFRQKWNETCYTVGLPALSLKTSAQISAIVLHFGDREALTHSPHFMADCYYIMKKYGIKGSEITDQKFVKVFKIYERELRNLSEPPQWAIDLMKNMYGINL